MMNIHITRHGQVLPSGPESWSHADYPPGDMPLSDLGRRQAHLLGLRLADDGFRGLIYSSPYLRAIETACGVANAIDAVVVPAPAMREIVKRDGQMDGFTGLTANGLRKLHPRVQPPDDFPDGPHSHWWTVAAETDDEVEARVAPFVDALIQRDAAGGAPDCLLVGHGASTGGVIHHLLRRCAPDQIGPPEPGWNAALTSFRCDGSTGRVDLLRRMDTEHLPEEAITSNAQTRAEVLAARQAQQ